MRRWRVLRSVQIKQACNAWVMVQLILSSYKMEIGILDGQMEGITVSPCLASFFLLQASLLHVLSLNMLQGHAIVQGNFKAIFLNRLITLPSMVPVGSNKCELHTGKANSGIKIIRNEDMSVATTPSKQENRHTQESDANSDQSCDFPGAFQFKVLPAPPNKSKFHHFDDIPKSTLKIRQAQDTKKPSIMVPTEPNNNTLTINIPTQQKEGSFVDIKITNYPSNGEFDSIKVVEPIPSPSSQKSTGRLRSSHQLQPSQLRKSQTEPKFVTVNEYEGYAIKTNLVGEEPNFKKEKDKKENEREKMIASNCKSMTFLNALIPAKSSNIDASRVINQNRVTLKDYIFMANTSSKKAAQIKRKQLNESKKLKAQDGKVGLPPSLSASQLDSQHIKQRFHKEKYHISNDQMGTVVKQSIRNQLATLSGKIQRIHEWMEKHELVDNDQLIQLYSIRRELQDYNTKMDKSFELLNLSDCKLFTKGICQMMEVANEGEGGSSSELDILQQEI